MPSQQKKDGSWRNKQQHRRQYDRNRQSTHAIAAHKLLLNRRR
jgi:hypothetical protein